MKTLTPKKDVDYYNHKLISNKTKRDQLSTYSQFGQIDIFPEFKIFKLTNENEKHAEEKYVCLDFVIEFFKKYSTHNLFNIPRNFKTSKQVT